MSRNPGTGVYTLPAGTYGAPNTPIASAKYNAAMGDLEQDANAARPIASGGTNATNAAAARENLGTDDAANLTKGTVPDARLGANVVRRNTYPNATSANSLAEGLSITDGPSLTNFPYNSGVNNWRTLTIGSAGRGTQITQNYNDLNALYFRGAQDGWSTQWNSIWHSGNDGAGSGLDAGLFAGQLPAYYTNIVARLGYQPFNRDGDQFQGHISWNVGTGEKTFTTTPGVYLFGNSGSTGFYDSNGGGTVVWSYTVSTKTLNLANQVTVNGVGLVLNNGQTYAISINGSAGSASTATNADNANNLGGVAASGYVKNDGGTYNINISGTAANATNAASASNSANLGGVAAASYLKIADLRSTFAGIGVDEVGSLAVMSRISGGTFVPGDTSIASQLRYSNFDGSSLSGVGPSGNWMALSRVVGGAGLNSVGLWKRIA